MWFYWPYFWSSKKIITKDLESCREQVKKVKLANFSDKFLTNILTNPFDEFFNEFFWRNYFMISLTSFLTSFLTNFLKSVLVKLDAGWFCEWMIINLLQFRILLTWYALIKGHKEKKRKRDDMTMNLSHNIIIWVCPQFLCWILGVVPFYSWLISSCE